MSLPELFFAGVTKARCTGAKVGTVILHGREPKALSVQREGSKIKFSPTRLQGDQPASSDAELINSVGRGGF